MFTDAVMNSNDKFCQNFQNESTAWLENKDLQTLSVTESEMVIKNQKFAVDNPVTTAHTHEQYIWNVNNPARSPPELEQEDYYPKGKNNTCFSTFPQTTALGN